MTEFSVVDTWSENENLFSLTRPVWQAKAKCRTEGTDVFFHERYTHAILEAKKLCNICPVADQCLEFAIRNDAVGIWGGLTTVERRNVVRLRKRAKTMPLRKQSTMRHGRSTVSIN